jgi:predicted O-methyltransferase YrrM
MKDKFYIMRDSEQRKGLEDMIEWINGIRSTKEMNIIEIGSYTGESTRIFAENFKQVISVDPFVNDYDPNDLACSYAPFEFVYKEFLKNTISYSNIKSIRDTSENAFGILSEYKWDMVYIDGVHTVEGVYYDISNYKNIISIGGFIAGHDYGWGNVRHNLGRVFDDKIDATFIDGSWIKQIN